MHDLESSVELPPLRAIVAMTAHDISMPAIVQS